MKVIRLMTCESAFKANLIKAKLESEGIPSFVTNENFSALLPNFNRFLGVGIQVMIFESDLERAKEILELS